MCVIESIPSIDAVYREIAVWKNGPFSLPVKPRRRPKQLPRRDTNRRLKRSLNGTYVVVEPLHLPRYVDDRMFRYNNRATKGNPLTDADRFTLAASQVTGKRLTYAEPTGKVGETSSF